MEIRLMEEAGDSLARLPIAVTRRPKSQVLSLSLSLLGRVHLQTFLNTFESSETRL
jgi:hypothetical protein